MKYAKPLLFVLPFALVAGCVQSHRYAPTPVAVYRPVPAAVIAPPAPTSDVPAVRVYPDTAPPPAAPAAPVVVTPPGVSGADLTIADSVREVLKGQGALSGIARNVEATVDGGVVTLRGIVTSDTDREAIANRIAGLPGVTRVDNQLTVELR